MSRSLLELPARSPDVNMRPDLRQRTCRGAQTGSRGRCHALAHAAYRSRSIATIMLRSCARATSEVGATAGFESGPTLRMAHTAPIACQLSRK
jgi:hypothetical protein